MKALVLSSGGIDSTTALAIAVQLYGHNNVVSLSVSYGQKHLRELQAAEEIAKYYEVEHICIDLTNVFKDSDSALLTASDREIPKESYEKQINKTKEEKPVDTYVPFRNGIFLSVATAIALSHNCDILYYGAHKDDAAGAAYPDCSEAFNDAMSTAIWEGSGCALKTEAPFINMNKADIVNKGLELGVPYELTWSCYEGGDKPCGKCGTCLDRARAFAANGVDDPAIN